MLFFFVLLTIFFLGCYINKRKLSFFSPVDVFVFFYLSVIILTFLYHFIFPKGIKINLFNLDFNNIKKFDLNILIFLKWMTFFLVGHFFFKSLNKNYILLIQEKTVFNFNKYLSSKFAFQIVFILFFVSVVLVFFDYGYGLFYRTKYIPYESSYFKLVYNILFLAVSFLTGYFFKHNKVFYSIIIFFVLILNLAIGTRLASINLIVFIFSLFLNFNKPKAYQIITSIVFVVFFFGYNLSLRTESFNHGLIPYLKITFQNPEIILKYTIDNIYYTFIFGFYASAETVKMYNSNNFDQLLISINPLTGGMAKWYLIVDKMKLNTVAPFTGIGVISKHTYFFFFFTFFVGYFFSYIDSIIKNGFKRHQYILPLVLLLFCTLFCILMFEYNLRNASRFLYYSLFVIIIFKLNYRNGKLYFKV
jgi:hypothetical protein